jgi:hypothetical protein
MACVSIVIVSFGVRDLLRACLASVRDQEGPEHDCWVVDNASPDGSADMVRQEFPEANLIANEANVGFARANNQALARATGNVLLLLNPDTEMPPGTLAAFVEVFERRPKAGAAGIALRGADGRPQASCHAFPGVLNQILEALGLGRAFLGFGIGTTSEAPWPPGGAGEVDWVNGACMALRREAYQEVGGLDESRFMYGEEMDWSWRARARGWSTVFVPAPAVLHLGGASGTGLVGRLFVLNLESRLQFLRRYRGAWRATISREILVLASVLRWCYWRLRALLGAAGASRTRDQLERFGAVLRWRFGGRP